MAKRGTLDNPKTKRLARALRTVPGVALGLLETLWHWVGEFRRDGGLSRIDVEDALDSGGWLTMHTADEVIAAMTDEARECVWLDRLPDGRFYVHHHDEHADDAVHRWLARRTEAFANGRTPDLTRLGKDERERIRGEYERTYGVTIPDKGGSVAPPRAQGAQDGAPSAHVGRTLGALPEPEPEPEPEPGGTLGRTSPEDGPPSPAAPPLETDPAPVPDWRRRIDGRWCRLGDRLRSEEVVSAIEAFDAHRLRLGKGGLDDGKIEALCQFVTDRGPSDGQLAAFFRLVVSEGYQTPNTNVFRQFLAGTFRPKRQEPPPARDPVGDPVAEDQGAAYQRELRRMGKLPPAVAP